MQQALALAEHAKTKGEIPVGAVLVYEDQVIGRGWNQSISQQDPTAHAEIVALREGAQKLNNYRLINTTLYVTLEPCLMCVGALVHARIHHCVYGAQDTKRGALERLPLLSEIYSFNHQLTCTSGILAQASSKLLKEFFYERR